VVLTLLKLTSVNNNF